MNLDAKLLPKRYNQSMSLKIFSFFSGCGFLDLGFELSGYKIEMVNEISKSFLEAYKFSRKKLGLSEPEFGYSNEDINIFLSKEGFQILSREIDAARKDGSLVGFIGGPPCPDFSIAGKQKGRSGDNGKLTSSYVSLIVEQKPDFFLFENVKGLWKTAKHRAFYDEMKDVLISSHYILFDRLTNSLEYGVPQDRDRILLFGIREDVSLKRGLSTEFPWKSYQEYDLSMLKSLPWPKSENFKEGSSTECPANIPIELTAEYWFRKNDVESHANSKDCFAPKAGLPKMKIIQEGDDSRKSYKRIHRWRYSPTVCYGNNEVHLHPYRVRRLSVAEALSLQSLPKEFQLPPEMSLSDKFKTVGNGVPFLLAKGIALTIKDYLKENANEAAN